MIFAEGVEEGITVEAGLVEHTILVWESVSKHVEDLLVRFVLASTASGAGTLSDLVDVWTDSFFFNIEIVIGDVVEEVPLPVVSPLAGLFKGGRKPADSRTELRSPATYLARVSLACRVS